MKHWKSITVSTALIGLVLARLAYHPLTHTMHTPDYSYSHWRAIYHVPVPACTLPSVETGDPETSPLCKETGKKPTEDQIIAWSSYTAWVSCFKYHSPHACAELSN